MLMGIRFVPLLGGVPPSRGSWKFRSSAIRVFRLVARRQKSSGEGGAGVRGLCCYFTRAEGVSSRRKGTNKSLFCLILWRHLGVPDIVPFSSGRAAGFGLG